MVEKGQIELWYVPPPCPCVVCGERVETETAGYAARITYPAGRAYWEVHHVGCWFPMKAVGGG